MGRRAASLTRRGSAPIKTGWFFKRFQRPSSGLMRSPRSLHSSIELPSELDEFDRLNSP
jgi:hypothetical protein